MPNSGLYSSLGANANIIRDMFTQLSGDFAVARETYPLMWKEYATQMPAGSRSKRFNWAECMAQVREWQGEHRFDQLKNYDYTLSVREWEAGLEWKRDELADDQTATMQLAINEFPNNFMAYQDTLWQRFVNNHIAGTTTEFAAGFDGVSTFSASHTWGADAVYTSTLSNLLAGSNTGKLDLTYGFDNLQTAYRKLTSGFFYPWSDGHTGRIRQTPTHLLCAGDVYFNAKRILASPMVESGSTATYGLPSSNVLNNLGIIPILMPDFTNGYWVMCCMNRPVRFSVFLDRGDQELDFQGPGSHAWQNNRVARATAWHRYSVGSGLWYTAVAGDGT